MRERHQDWEALLEKALAEECSAPASLLELVRQEKRSSCPFLQTVHTQGGASAVCLSTALCAPATALCINADLINVTLLNVKTAEVVTVKL